MKPFPYFLACVLGAGLMASAAATEGDSAALGLTPEQRAFFEKLQALCGAQFMGWTVYPDEPGEPWQERLLAKVNRCEPQEVRIALSVGSDHSRTWIVRPTAQGLQLKHDHRYPDGRPHEVTNYGGTTRTAGTALAQSFPADAHTAELLPEAASNQWFLSFDDSSQTLIYYLERHQQPRFRAVLERQ